MRVVLLNQYYAPDEAATAQLLADVGAGLAQAGHQVTAVCSRRAYADPARGYPARESIDGVDVRRAWGTGFGRETKLGRLIDYATFLLGATVRLAFVRRPDVVISLSTPPMVAVLGWGLARLRGARTIYWVMDVYPDLAYELGVLRPGSLAGGALDRLSGFMMRHSDRVVALGERMAERLPASAAGHTVVVHNWADEAVIRPQLPTRNRLRAEWGWHDRFVVLYSGNMGLAHEFETVLGAANRLREHLDILFAFVGGGPRRGQVESEVARLRLPNVEVRTSVARDRLGDSLTAGDLHLVTLRDGLQGLLVPSKIYGILAAGRPTLYIGPDEGEIAEIVRRGECGSRIAPGDDEALARTILDYRKHPEQRETEGRSARELFEREFTRTRGVEAFVELVRAVAA